MGGDFLQPREASLAEALGEMQQTANELRAERDAARAAVARVRRLHQQYRAAGVDEFDICPECSQYPVHVPWPCDTVRALDPDPDPTGLLAG